MKRILLLTCLSFFLSINSFSQCLDPLKFADSCDFDLDGILNIIDLDDDNDGILDIEESNCTAVAVGLFEWDQDFGFSGASPNVQSLMPLLSDVVEEVTLTVSLSDPNNDIKEISVINGFGFGNILEIEHQAGQIGGSTTTFDFSSVVSDVTFSIQDIDGVSTDFIDEVVIKAKRPDGTIILIDASNYGTLGNHILYQGNNKFEADPTQGSAGDPDAGGVLNLFFDEPISSIDITYSNIDATKGTIQRIGIADLSFNKKCNLDLDSDGDGIPNRCDLDSDNDGCADAIEAGATLLNSPDTIAGPYGANGLANSVETAVESGIVNYIQTYVYVIDSNTNACDDFDNDGITDVIDIDDDNDGILDSDEGGSCETSDWGNGNWTVIPGLVQNYAIVSDNGDTINMNITVTTSSVGSFLDQLNLSNSEFGGITDLELKFDPISNQGTSQIDIKVTFDKPVENLNFSITDIDAGATRRDSISIKSNVGDPVSLLATNSTNSIITRLTSNGATSTNVGSFNNDIGTVLVDFGYKKVTSFTIEHYEVGGYINPEARGVGVLGNMQFCFDRDSDGDGIPNSKDLDSDNDGCADAIESGATLLNSPDTIAGPYGANGLANSVETAAESGVVNYALDYDYATDSATNACDDKDNDGIPDVKDLDDDNDGILDIEESNCTAVVVGLFEWDQDFGFSGTSPNVQNLIPLVSDAVEEVTLTVSLSDPNNDIKEISVINGFGFGNILEIEHQAGKIGGSTTTFDFSSVVSDVAFSIQDIDAISTDFIDEVVIKAKRPDGTIILIDASNYGTLGNHILYQGSNRFGADPTQGNAVTSDAGGVLNLFFDEPISSIDITFSNVDATKGTTQRIGIADLSFNKKCNLDLDSDGDGIPNRCDLDSDNDGCADAIEAGATLLNSPDTIAGPYGANGLANSVETAAESGVVNYALDYDYATDSATNACDDKDNDGIPDVKDLDDDNDGILDIEESNCTAVVVGLFEWDQDFGFSGTSPNVQSLIPLLSDVVEEVTLTVSLSDPNNDIKEISVINGFGFGNILEIEHQAGQIGGSTTTFDFSSVVSDVTFSIQDIDGVSTDFIDEVVIKAKRPDGTIILIDASNYGTLGNHILYQGNNRFRADPTQGNAGTSDAGGVLNLFFDEPISSIDITYSNIDAIKGTIQRIGIADLSFNKKCNVDVDGDGIPNSCDLDSDNDGCADVIESGATLLNSPDTIAGPYGANGLANSVETAAESGVVNYALDYDYATDSATNACDDKDNDGIPDVKDLDDDNDGILDTEESNCTAVVVGLFEWDQDFGFSGTSPNVQSLMPLVSDVVEEVTLTVSLSDPNNDIKEISVINGFGFGNILEIEHQAGQIGGSTTTFDFSSVVSDVTFSIQDIDAISTDFIDEVVIKAKRPDGTIILIDASNYGTLGNHILYQGNNRFGADPTQGNAVTSDAGGVLNLFFEEPISSIDITYSNIDAIKGTTQRIGIADLSFNKKCNVDVDGDGIPNSCDLDSDNDGCLDVVEAGHGIMIQADSTIVGPYGDNGLSDAIESDDSQTATITYTLDTSENGTAVYLDSSNNSACFCEIEITATDTIGCSNSALAQMTVDTNGGTWSTSGTYGTAVDGFGNVVLGFNTAVSNVTDTIFYNLGVVCKDTILVEILPNVTATLDTTICNGANFIFNGTTYSAGNLTGIETLTASNGCDSVVTVIVTESPAITGVIDITICSTDSIIVNGTTYDSSNTSGIETLLATNGCDSLITVNLTIIQCNSPPVVNDDSVSTIENTAVTINPLTNDNDSLDNMPIDSATVKIITGGKPNSGTTTTDSTTGVITYTPNSNFFGNDTLTYEVCDLGTPVLCDTAAIIIMVVPVIDTISVTIPEDSSYTICDTTLSSVDADSVLLCGDGTNGITIITGDCFTYAPDSNFFGSDTVCYMVCNDGICDTTIVIVSIAPSIDTLSITLPEDSIYILCDTNLIGTTGDLVSLCGLGNNGTVIVTGVCFEYKPDTNFVGLDTVCYVVCKNGMCDTTIILITVNPINDSPIAKNDSVMVSEDDSVEVDPLVNDFDLEGIDSTTIDIVTVPVNGTASIDSVTGVITYTPDSNFTGIDSLHYVMCDTGHPVLCDTAWMFIEVKPVNDSPIAKNDSVMVSEDDSVEVDPLVNDFDLEGIDSTTIDIVTVPVNGTASIDSVTGVITYTPDSNFTGIDSLHYVMCDTGHPVLCDTAWMFIEVKPVNDSPIAKNDSVMVSEDDSVEVDPLVNDFDLEGIDSTTIDIVTVPVNGTASIDSVTGVITYTPDSNFTGIDSLHYVMCDTGHPVLCDTAWMFIEVNPINDSPIAKNDSVIVSEDDSVEVDPLVNDFDLEGIDSTTIDIVTVPVNGTASIDSVTGVITYTPDSNFTGIDSLHYVICDTGHPVLCDTAWMFIEVNPINDSPIAKNDSVIVSEDDSVEVDPLVNDFDLEGIDSTTIDIVTVPVNGTASIDSVTGVITYTPDSNFTGIDSLHYVMCDTGHPVLCDTAWMFIEVNPINDSPIAKNDSASTNSNTPVLIDPLVNDNDNLDNVPLDSTAVSVIMGGDPTGGTAMIDTVTGVLTYIPNTGFSGLDSLTYQVCDLGMPILCDTAIIYISVRTPVISDTIVTKDTSVCLDTTELPGTRHTMTLCDGGTSTSGGGTVTLDLTTGCVFVSPEFGMGLTDTACVIICDTVFGICDTTLIITIKPPTKDTIVTKDTAVCLDTTELLGTRHTMALCDGGTSTSGGGAVTLDSTIGCVVISPEFGMGLTDTTCVIICDTVFDICDTTLIISVAQPMPDTIYVQTIPNSNADTCVTLESSIMTGQTVTTCDGAGTTSKGIPVTITGLCVKYPVPGPVFTGDTVCIVVCDTIHGGVVCDTTLIIYVPDVTPPTVLCKNDTVYLNGLGTVMIDRSNVLDTAYDNTLMHSVYLSSNSFNCLNIGGNNVAVYAVDTNRNIDSCIATVTVLDTLAPIAACQNITIQLDSSGEASIVALDIDGGSSDNCAIASIVADKLLFDCSNLGYNTVSLTVTDNYGNTSVCTATVEVEDNIAPEIDCPTEEPIVLRNRTCVYVIKDYTDAKASWDNCDTNDVIVTQSPAAGTEVVIEGEYSQFVTLIATDLSENFSTCTIEIPVKCQKNIDIPQFFSPDGNGANDTWEIPELANYPNNVVKVFNRWGNLVFEERGYIGGWDGVANADRYINKVLGQRMLPEGTYYYIIDLGDGNFEPYVGYMQLRR